MPGRETPRVAIVGAGFGGLWASRALAGTPTDVHLIDRNNYHTFFPLLYQVAAAEIDPGDIAHPVRNILRRHRNIRFHLAEVEEVHFEARTLKTGDGDIPYDYLILATGSATHFFGVPGAAENAFPLRTLKDGIDLRNHILCQFERAAHEADAEQRRRLLTFVVVGGGPTGVEYAGALQELILGPLARDFPTLNLDEVQVVLLEALERLLGALPQRLGNYALRRLQKMGVQVRLRATVSQVDPGTVRLDDGQTVPTETVVWTAGVRGDPKAEAWGLPTDRRGQVEVLPTLQVPEHHNVYVVGDLAAFRQGGEPLPMVAQTALQQGGQAAKNILRQIEGKDPETFRYKDYGTMAVIGRNSAVAHLFGRWSLTGFPAWAMWLGIHLIQLIGFRNRIVVLTNWAWDYLFYERVVRLILP